MEKSLNKTILVFFVVVMMLIYGAWEIIRSDYVASYIGKKISQVISKQDGLLVSFENLSVNPLSLGVSVDNVHFESPKFGGTVDSLDINLGFFSFFKSKLSLNEIEIIGGEFTIEAEAFKSSEKTKKKLNIRESLNELFDNAVFERFRKVRLHNSRVEFDGNEFKLSDFYIHNFKELKVLAGRVRIKSELLEKNNLEFDGVDLSATLSRNKLTVSPLLIRSDIDSLVLKSEIVINKSGIPLTSGTIDFSLSTDKLNRLMDLGFEGVLAGSVAFGGPLKNIDADFKIQGEDLKSKYYELESLGVELKYLNNKLKLNKFKAFPRRGKISLTEPFEAYDFKSKNLNLENIKLTTEKIYSRDVLGFLGEDLDIMNLALDGNIELNISDDVDLISFHLLDNFKLLKCELVGDSISDKILTIDGLVLTEGLIEINRKSDETKIILDSKRDDFNINVDGVISPQNTFFKVKGDNVDFKYLEDIGGVKLNGKGILDLEIFSNEETKIDVRIDMDDFGVVDFYLGKSVGKVSYNLDQDLISVDSIKSMVNKSPIEITGSYDLKDDVLVLKGKHKDNRIEDLLETFGNYLEVPKEVKEKLDGRISLQYVLAGPIDKNKMTARAVIKSNNLVVDEVNIKNFDTDVDLEEGIIKVPNLKFNVFGGTLNARYEYHLSNDYQDIDFTLTNSSISSVPYLPKFTNPVKGGINIEGFGAGRPEDFNLKVGLDINDLNVSNELYRRNYIDFIWDTDSLLIDLEFFNSQVITKANLNLGNNEARKSYIRSSINFKSLNPFFYTINSNLKSRQSSLKSRFAASFEVIADLPNKNVESVNVDISDFYLRHYANTLSLKPGKSKIVYSNGLVKQSDIHFSGTGKFLKYELKQIDKLTFTNNFKLSLPLTLLELVVPNTEFNSGQINGEVEYFSGFENYFKEGRFQIADLNFQPRGAPVTFDNFQGDILLNNRDVSFKNMTGTIGKGDFRVNGGVSFANIVPDVDVRFNLHNSLIVPFENSKFLLSAEGAIRGKKLPYLIDGKIVIYHSEINESIDKLSGEKGEGKGKSKYLPSLKINEQSKFVRTNFFIEFIKPMVITNDLFSLNLVGSGTILGDFDEIKFDGEFITDNKSENIILIKGHRFKISDAKVLLREDDNDSSVLVKGKTRIKDHEIFLVVDGPLKKIKVTLTSEPALAKKDIFSLITFGYTTQTSQELDQDDRNSIATVGIGSLIFDQLKIGQGLNSSLGLKMSISPEFQTEEGSLMDGKSAVSTARRLRSATRIKLEKSFSDKVDMSFSNTVGGSVQQKQEMNVIFKVNDNVSIDGVLEVKEVDEESTESPESLGADLKFKWSF